MSRGKKAAARCENIHGDVLVYLRVIGEVGERSCYSILNENDEFDEVKTNLRVASTNQIDSNAQNSKVQEFKFNEIFSSEISQATFYEKTAKPLVSDLLSRGKNSLLLVHGLSSPDKVKTALGNGSDKGIVPRFLDDMFECKEIRSRSKSVVVSMFEVFDERLFDLLKHRQNENESIELVEKSGACKGINATKHKIDSPQKCIDLIRFGSSNRNNCNQSEGSASICSLSIESSDETNPPALWIVDLISRSCDKKSYYLNSNESACDGLFKVWKCLETMRYYQTVLAKNKLPIPFRESTMTKLFMRHLSSEAGGKTVMIVNINTKGNLQRNLAVLSNSSISQRVLGSKEARDAISKPHLRYNRKFSKGHCRIHKLNRRRSEGCEGLLSGAESDGTLFDRKKAFVKHLEEIECQNEHLQEKVSKSSELKGKRSLPSDSADFIAAEVIGKLREKLQREVELRQQQEHEIAELEAEFEHFVDENGLDEGDPGPGNENLYAQIARLSGELVEAKNEAILWQKTALQANSEVGSHQFANIHLESPLLPEYMRRESRGSSSTSISLLQRGIGNRNGPFSPLGDVWGFPNVASPPGKMQVVAISRRASVLRLSEGSKSRRSSSGHKGNVPPRYSDGGLKGHRASKEKEKKEATFFSKLRMMVLKVTPRPGHPRNRSKGETIPITIKKTNTKHKRTGTRSPTLDAKPEILGEFQAMSSPSYDLSKGGRGFRVKTLKH